MSSCGHSDADGNGCHFQRTVFYSEICLGCQEKNNEENKSSGIMYTQGEWEEVSYSIFGGRSRSTSHCSNT